MPLLLLIKGNDLVVETRPMDNGNLTFHCNALSFPALGKPVGSDSLWYFAKSFFYSFIKFNCLIINSLKN